MFSFLFFFQAEDGIRDLVRSRGLGDVYKRQQYHYSLFVKVNQMKSNEDFFSQMQLILQRVDHIHCLLYTSDAADERSSVDLGGRRIIKKKKKEICIE